MRRPRHTHPPRGWAHRFAHSLKWRLIALFLALALGVGLVFVGGTRQVFANGWREMVRPLVADYVDRLAAEIGDPPELARAEALVARLPLSLRIDGPRLHWSSDPARFKADHAYRDPLMRAMLTRHTADGHELVFGLAAWRWADQPLQFHAWPLLALLGLTAAAFAYVRRLFKPLDDIRAGALRYGAGDFNQPIPLRHHDELGELATQVNAMAGNLQRMLEGQRGLLLAISHELRSPLTRARLNAELVDEGPSRDALLRDLGEMRDLISDLLESERLARGPTALHTEPTDLNAIVREQWALRGSVPDLALDLDPALPLLALDRTRIALLARNLIDNALRHGQGSALSVQTARAADGTVTLTVRDQGPGVTPEQLSRLAQPFHRTDAARSRESGGVGLGLYLCRLVAESHGGSLRFERAEPGLRVTLALPPAVAVATAL